MFVGTTGIDRVVERTAQLMTEHDTDDVVAHGGIPLEIIQKYINFHYTRLARSVRQRDLHERGQLLHGRIEGTLERRSAAGTTTS